MLLVWQAKILRSEARGDNGTTMVALVTWFSRGIPIDVAYYQKTVQNYISQLFKYFSIYILYKILKYIFYTNMCRATKQYSKYKHHSNYVNFKRNIFYLHTFSNNYLHLKYQVINHEGN